MVKYSEIGTIVCVCAKKILILQRIYILDNLFVWIPADNLNEKKYDHHTAIPAALLLSSCGREA